MQNQRPHNPNPSQNVKHFKPEPMDTLSSNSRYTQPKPNITHIELFNQKVNNSYYFENPFENESEQYYENVEYLDYKIAECSMGARYYYQYEEFNENNYNQSDYALIELNQSNTQKIQIQERENFQGLMNINNQM